jgi:hypothetical protein
LLREPLLEWLQDAVCDSVTVSEDSSVEAQDNLWRFSLTKEQACELCVDEVLEFLENVIESRRQFLIHELDRQSMLMYVWFDEMAGALCLCLSSSKECTALPFSCAIDPNAKLADIVSEFLGSSYLEGIPKSELEPTAPGNPCSEPLPPEPLSVYVIRLP